MTTQLSYHGQVSHPYLCMYLVVSLVLQQSAQFILASHFLMDAFESIWTIATHIYLFYSFPPQYNMEETEDGT
jgi:hypothetical protein